MFTLGFTILGQTGKIFMVGGVLDFFVVVVFGLVFFRTEIIFSVYICGVSTARSMQQLGLLCHST